MDYISNDNESSEMFPVLDKQLTGLSKEFPGSITERNFIY
jgi:hypothetical protein